MIHHILQVLWADMKALVKMLAFILVIAGGFSILFGLGWIIAYYVLGVQEKAWGLVPLVSLCLVGLIGYVLRIIELADAARQRQEVAEHWKKIRSENGTHDT